MTSSLHGQHIVRKAAHGILWSYASFGLGKALVFLTTVVLARLLTPDFFGIVALATLAVNYLGILKDFGLGAALIQRRDDVEQAANTVFTLNLLLGLGLTLLAILAAPWVALFFSEPQVTPVLRWLSLTFTLDALSSVHTIRLQRELDFRRKLIPDLGRSIVKGVTSISLALAGYGVWSLVIGQLVGSLSTVILAWLVVPWRPRLTINHSILKSLLSYGFSLMSLDILAVIEDNLDYLIVGCVFGNTALGIYTLAYRLPELLGLNTLWIIAGALFPAFASVQHQPDLLRRGFLLTLRYVEMFSVPVSLGLFIAADPLVRVAFGERWSEAIPVVQVLAIFVLVTSIGFNVGDIYKAVGRPDILMKLGLLRIIMLGPALWYGAHFGLVGIAYGHLVVRTIQNVLYLWVATRFIKVSLADILQQLKPSFLSGLALLLLAWPSLYATANAAPIIRLGVVMIAGATGYLSALWLLEGKTLLQAGRTLGLPGLSQPSPPASSLALDTASGPEVG
ncbi:MAG: lipopolysaccharide biosynthesis protein [Anaerolineae bacterium]